jgi:hypothetical protein
MSLTEEEPEIGEIVRLSSTIVQEMARQAQIEFVSDIEEALPRLAGDWPS